MNQQRAIDRVFAVVSGVMVPARNINFPLPRKRIQTSRWTRKRRRHVLRLVRRINRLFRDNVPRV